MVSQCDTSLRGVRTIANELAVCVVPMLPCWRRDKCGQIYYTTVCAASRQLSTVYRQVTYHRLRVHCPLSTDSVILSHSHIAVVTQTLITF